MRAISDLSTLVFLNILTVIFCIPIVTAGASLAAMHYVIMEMIEDRGGGLLQEFWKRFRENLRNATPVWLILLAAAAFLYADQRIIAGGQLGLPRAMLIPIYVGAFVVAAVYVYAIPLTARLVRVFHRRSVQERGDPGCGISAPDDPDGCDHGGDPLPVRECLKAYAAVLPARTFAPGLLVCAAVQAGV